MPVPVVTAREAAARDVAVIAAGTPSRTLMERAGELAADAIVRHLGGRLAGGVAVHAGPGNNGGDAWVVARILAGQGATVRVREAAPARTPDAIAEREAALPVIAGGAPRGDEALVVDGLLGTGASGAPRGAIADAILAIARAREGGARVVALDVPSGVDAATGDATGAVRADLTVTFGAMKRGLLVARGCAGAIEVVDIGLDWEGAAPPTMPRLIDARWVAARIPPIPADAHKGTRRKLAIVGGAAGMCGAVVLAARAALRSGIGMVKAVVAPASLPVIQAAEPHALAAAWPRDERELASLVDWADAVAIGPGLGASEQTRRLAEDILRRWRGPVLLDADALNVFAGDAGALGALLDGRPAVLTPHVLEFARLAGVTPGDVLAQRYDIGGDLAPRARAAVLLKGVPTIVTDIEGRRLVSAAGGPALATAGSGDVLSGIAATLLAQTGDAPASAACAAWVHGRAAELATTGRPVRGVTLDDVVAAIADVWRFDAPRLAPSVLAALPAAGEEGARCA